MDLFVIPLSMALLLAFTVGTGHAADKWGYDEKDGPEHWAEMDPAYNLCKEGKNQTPIDIRAEFDVELPPIALDYSCDGASIVNNGHTIQVDFPAGGLLKAGNREFSLTQAHFHAPAENSFYGKRYPFEAHFVHQDAAGALAVLYTLGREHPGFAWLWKQAPSEQNTVFPLAGGFAPMSILPEGRDYVYFNGSLTTPPGSEGVRWFVLKEFPEISEEQVRVFAKKVGHANNRPLQPVNARVILD